MRPSIDQRARKTASPAADLPPFTADSLGKPLSPQFPFPPGDSVPHQKPIAAEFQTASFKSPYRKRSGNQESHLPSSLICRSVSDTALGLHDHWPLSCYRTLIVTTRLSRPNAGLAHSGCARRLRRPAQQWFLLSCQTGGTSSLYVAPDVKMRSTLDRRMLNRNNKMQSCR